MIGPHGVGKCDTNGERLLALCSERYLQTQGTSQDRMDAHRSKHKHWQFFGLYNSTAGRPK